MRQALIVTTTQSRAKLQNKTNSQKDPRDPTKRTDNLEYVSSDLATQPKVLSSMSYSYLDLNQPVLQFTTPTGRIVKFQLQHFDDQSAYLVFVDDFGVKQHPPQDITLWRVTFHPSEKKMDDKRIETQRKVRARNNEFLIHWDHNYDMRCTDILCYRLTQQKEQSYTGIGDVDLRVISKNGHWFTSSAVSESISSSDTSSSSSSDDEPPKKRKNKKKDMKGKRKTAKKANSPKKKHSH